MGRRLFCVCLPLFWFFLYIIYFNDRCDEGRGGAVLKSSLDKMIQLLLPKIQFTEKTNLHIYLASNFTNVHNGVHLVRRRLNRQFVLHTFILLGIYWKQNVHFRSVPRLGKKPKFEDLYCLLLCTQENDKLYHFSTSQKSVLSSSFLTGCIMYIYVVFSW